MAQRSVRVLGFSVAAFLSASSALASGVFVNIGVLGDGAFSDAFGVNSGGQVVGSSRTGSFSIYSHAVLFTAGPGGSPVLSDLGTLGGSTSGAAAINSSGAIVGSAQVIGDVAYRAFYLSSGGSMRSLGTLGGSNSAAAAINASGQVVGEAETDFFGNRAFRTSADGGAMTNLGTLGGQFSSAKAINDSGQVAGYASLPPDGANPTVYRAFRYTGNPGFGGAMADLGTLGGPDSVAYGINNAGVVVGEADVSYDPNTGDRVTHAFRYTGTPGAGGAMTDLGTLGGPNSVAASINNYSQIVGKSDINNVGDSSPFVYVNGQMIDLNAWLDTFNPAVGLNTFLRDARSISDTGYIVGEATVVTAAPFTMRVGYRLDAISLLGLPGDANRDHTVNFTDLLTLAQNYGRTTGAVWDNGDFDGDGAVLFVDLLTLAQRYGTSGLSVEEMSKLPSSFAADWAMAQSLVPEPVSAVALGLIAVGARRQRR